MNWRDLLINRHRDLVVYISTAQLNALLEEAGIPKQAMFPADKWWICIDRGAVVQVLLDSGLRNREFVEEIGDCDNFALEGAALFSSRRKGECVGECWGNYKGKGSHAALISVSPQHKLEWTEPQSYLELEPPTHVRLAKFC